MYIKNKKNFFTILKRIKATVYQPDFVEILLLKKFITANRGEPNRENDGRLGATFDGRFRTATGKRRPINATMSQ